MTSLTIAASLTPTAFQLGEGADLRAPLAATVLGGVISSTALTLVLVPVVYTLLDGLTAQPARLRHIRLGRMHVGQSRGDISVISDGLAGTVSRVSPALGPISKNGRDHTREAAPPVRVEDQ